MFAKGERHTHCVDQCHYVVMETFRIAGIPHKEIPALLSIAAENIVIGDNLHRSQVPEGSCASTYEFNELFVLLPPPKVVRRRKKVRSGLQRSFPLRGLETLDYAKRVGVLKEKGSFATLSS